MSMFEEGSLCWQINLECLCTLQCREISNLNYNGLPPLGSASRTASIFKLNRNWWVTSTKSITQFARCTCITHIYCNEKQTTDALNHLFYRKKTKEKEKENTLTNKLVPLQCSLISRARNCFLLFNKASIPGSLPFILTGIIPSHFPPYFGTRVRCD